VPELSADLVRRRVAVIFGGAVLGAKAATTTIPIVFSTGGDPVALGLVASLNRPGGNMTGVTTFNSELAAKRLGFMHNLLPGAARFAVLVNPNEPTAFREPYTRDAQGAGLAMGWQIEVVTASTNSEIDTAFASLVQKRADALLVSASSLFRDRRVQLAMLAVRHAVPAIYVERGFTEAGGLMSYGSSLLDQRQIGVYVGRILNGAKPADLPLMQSTKFELVINLQTAKTLGPAIPETLLATADEVIQ
jgi:putative ABC transport system substrate-binding protein